MVQVLIALERFFFDRKIGQTVLLLFFVIAAAVVVFIKTIFPVWLIGGSLAIVSLGNHKPLNQEIATYPGSDAGDINISRPGSFKSETGPQL